jgi:GTP-binding protein
MKLPVIAIVGRPNVGKSAFFNRVVGRRVSIVDPTAGVTRDRVSLEVSLAGRRFELIDTGGIGLFDETMLKQEIQQQIEIAIASADGVLFMVDVREGAVPLDFEVARRLRAVEKPVLLVANKADTLRMEYDCHPFHSLGFGDPLPVSALEGRSVQEAVERLLERIPETMEGEEACGEYPKVAVVGKMNAGKSTLVNFLANEDRVIVSEIPGTTRDSVDVRVEIDGTQFVVIDTAGVRRKRAIQDSVDFYGQARSARAIRRADVVLLLLDVTHEVTSVDKRIADDVRGAYKPCILCLNKWDLVEGHMPGDFSEYLWDRMPGMRYAPLSFISAETGFNVRETFRMVPELWKQASERISPSLLNKVLQEAFTRRAPRTRKSKVAKIYFGSQVGVRPPTLLIFVNEPALFKEDYERYLVGRFREALPFKEIPIRIKFKGKS